MKRDRLDLMTKGWFIGDFEPVVLASKEVEVAIKYYSAGDIEVGHLHKVATEITAILAGRVLISGQEMGPGDIVTITPGEAACFEALTDACTVVVKMPSVASDKYSLKNDLC